MSKTPPTSEHDSGRRDRRANRPQHEARVGELLRIRLDGAEWWDCREYVSEKSKEEKSCWKLADNEPPYSDRQLRRYIAEADKLISLSCKRSRAALIRHHRAKTRNLYAKAVAAAEFTAALRCLQEEAKMNDLYPKALPPLEVILAALPPAVAGVVRRAIADAVAAGGTGGGQPQPEQSPGPDALPG